MQGYLLELRRNLSLPSSQQMIRGQEGAAGTATCFKKLLEDFECVLCCSKNHSLFHPASALLGCDLWKVTSPRAISFSMYSWMFEEQFPRNSLGSKRELERTLTKGYGTVDTQTAYGTSSVSRWRTFTPKSVILNLFSQKESKGEHSLALFCSFRSHALWGSPSSETERDERETEKRKRWFSQFTAKLKSLCACVALKSRVYCIALLVIIVRFRVSESTS